MGRDNSLRLKIISLFHESALGGYLRVYVTTKRLPALFYWRGVEKQTRNL